MKTQGQMTLREVGRTTGTDKADSHEYHGESYLDVYEKYVGPMRHTAKQVLEFGVLNGASLRTWRDYFSVAHIYGVDIDPAANNDYGQRTTVFTASQTDPTVLAKISGDLDVIVDDGSHLVSHIVESFYLWWPRLKRGGFYFIEDLEASYYDMSPWRKTHPGHKYNPDDTDYNNTREKLESALFKPLIHKMDNMTARECPSTITDVRMIHFWPNQCVIQKAW